MMVIEVSGEKKLIATIDTRGLECPVPMFKTLTAIRLLPPGACFAVLYDDNSLVADLMEVRGVWMRSWREDGVFCVQFMKDVEES